MELRLFDALDSDLDLTNVLSLLDGNSAIRTLVLESG